MAAPEAVRDISQQTLLDAYEKLLVRVNDMHELQMLNSGPS